VWVARGGLRPVRCNGCGLDRLLPFSHALVVDGVYAQDGLGGLRCHPATPPTDEETNALLGTIARRIDRLLARSSSRGR
jgi:hypothetical protein